MIKSLNLNLIISFALVSLPNLVNANAVIKNNLENKASETHYAYVSQANIRINVLQKCSVDSAGGFSNCKETGQGFFHTPTSVSFYNKFAYVANYSSTYKGVSQCTIEGDGELTNCTSIKDATFGYISGLAVHNNHLYVVNHGAPISECSIDPQTGVLSNCVRTGNEGTRANGITFNDNFSYITNITEDGDNVLQCEIDPKTGNISTICKSVMGFSQPNGIAINNNYAYIANSSDTRIEVCSLDKTGGLSNCKFSENFFAAPTGVTFYNNSAYISNSGNGLVSQCMVNKTTGDLSNCQTVGKEFDFGKVWQVNFN